MDKINAAAPNSKRCKRRKHTANPLRRRQRLRRRTTDDGGRTTDRGNRKENNNNAHNQLGEIPLVLRAGATKMLRASFAGSKLAHAHSHTHTENTQARLNMIVIVIVIVIIIIILQEFSLNFVCFVKFLFLGYFAHSRRAQ